MQITEARRRRGKLDRAAGVATFNAWSLAVAAAVSLPFAFFSVTGALMFTVLGVTAIVEFHGRKLLRAMDLRGPVMLTCNQAALGAAVILYAAVQLHAAMTGEGHYAAVLAQAPELAASLGPIEGLIRQVEVGTYALLIAGTLAFQGGMAMYYITRRPHLRAYLADTPAWVTEVLRAAA